MNGPRLALRGAWLLAFALAGEAARAQPAIAPSAAASAAERAQKETDRTMYWIRVLADRPAPVKAAPAPAAPKAAAPVAAPASKPVVEAREKPKSVVAPAATTTTAAAGKPATPALAPGLDTSEPTSALSSSGADKAAATLGTSVAPPPAVAMRAPEPAPAEEPDQGLAQIKSVRPDFPGRVVMRVHKGHVEVRFEVEPGGTVTDAVVVSTSDAHLNQAAIDAVKQWQFKPSSRYHTAAVDLAFDIDKE